MKRFERSNGLDTALYKNYLYLLDGHDLSEHCILKQISSKAKMTNVLKYKLTTFTFRISLCCFP